MSDPWPQTVVIVNPGSTSTKLAIAKGGSFKEKNDFRHPTGVLSAFNDVWCQLEYRLNQVSAWVTRHIRSCDAVISPGGLFRPVAGGTYLVSDSMLRDARANIQGEHASNLGCALAHAIAQRFGGIALVADPVSVDEFEQIARYSGHPRIPRRTLSHALNIHAAARHAADELGQPVSATSFVVAHLGGGISIAAVRGGRIIDVNDAASDGPFSPERTGGLPVQKLISLCFSGEFSESEMHSMTMGRGGLVAYLGTNSLVDVERRVESGDAFAAGVYEAMAYQIAKEIGAMSTVLRGAVDAIVLTGGMANSSRLVSWIVERVASIARVLIYPGEDEMNALAEAAMRVLTGTEQAKEYPA